MKSSLPLVSLIFFGVLYTAQTVLAQKQPLESPTRIGCVIKSDIAGLKSFLFLAKQRGPLPLAVVYSMDDPAQLIESRYEVYPFYNQASLYSVITKEYSKLLSQKTRHRADYLVSRKKKFLSFTMLINCLFREDSSEVQAQPKTYLNFKLFLDSVLKSQKIQKDHGEQSK